MQTVQFAGVYQIKDVKNVNGAEVSKEQEQEALRRYFLKTDNGWRGASGSGGNGAWVGVVRGDKLYVAVDDGQGKDGTALSVRVSGFTGTSRFINMAWRTVGIHHLAKAYLAIKSALYTNPRVNSAHSSMIKKARPAELVITTEPKNLLEEKVTDSTIRPL